MRKAFLSLVTLLVGVVTAYAQPRSWSYVGDNAYGYSHVVYAGLVNSSGTALNYVDRNSWLGAFIDGECRGVSQVMQYPLQGTVEFMYFPVRIYGEAADNGKAITFRLMTPDTNGNDGWEYILDSTSLTYSNEGTTGEPSSLFELTFEEPRYFTFPTNIEVKVGESIALKSLITFDPANSSVPVSLGEWDFGNSQAYINVSNDTLSGLKPTDQAYLGMPSEFMTIKSMNGNYDASVKVIQPATGISINPEYANGDTVYVNDSIALTYILNNCYTVTPADANEEVTWTWTPKEGIEIVTDENNGKAYNPTTAGNYKMEVKVGQYSATMALAVMNRVQRITAVTDTIHLFVGDNLSELMPYTVTFSPSEYIDKTLLYDVYTAGSTAAVMVNAGEWYAVAEGQATLSVKSPEILNSPAIIPIVVHPNVTDVETYEKTLTYEYNANGTDITNDVMNSFSFIPGKDYTPREGELTTSDGNICSAVYSSTENKWSIKTGNIGTATLTIKHSAKRTTLIEGALATNTITATGAFDVKVVQGLTDVSFDEVVMGRNSTYSLTLTPVPADAVFDGSLITVSVISSDIPKDWSLASIVPQANDKTGLNWGITPQAIGKGTINVSYNGNIISRKSITIGQSFTQKEGWDWVTPYGGYVQSIEKLYGDNLQEMRAQEAIVYNDPVYGYFGGLNAMFSNCCYKVKIKERMSVDAFNEEVNYASGTYGIPVRSKWNWIGFSYQHNHALTDVFTDPSNGGTTFTTGDRIVSKDNGFAEYDGSKWVGSLTTLAYGEGYLFYNASTSDKTLYLKGEETLGQPTTSGYQMFSKARASGTDVWQYNSSKFADNMTIVADLGAEYGSNRYSVGAFIGDECRGEGSYADGKWFITVHGDAKDNGQNVTFKVYDTMEGSTRLVENTQPYSAMAGTLRAPLHMTVGVVTGISEVNADADSLIGSELYTIDGRLVVGEPVPGIYVVKQNGTVRKVLVK